MILHTLFLRFNQENMKSEPNDKIGGDIYPDLLLYFYYHNVADNRFLISLQ